VKRHKWIVDKEANEICWKDLREEALEVLKPTPIKVIDIGGGSGAFSKVVFHKNRQNVVVTIDLDLDSLKRASEGIHPIHGNILKVPFKNGSFDGVLGRAILHHIPEELEASVWELKRILKNGGITVIQEPSDKNIFANFARIFFITEIHEEQEAPLDQAKFLNTLSKYLKVEKVRYHFFFSYIMPHIVARFRTLRKPLVSLTKLLVDIDKKLMKSAFFKKRAAYISIVALKPK